MHNKEDVVVLPRELVKKFIYAIITDITDTNKEQNTQQSSKVYSVRMGFDVNKIANTLRPHVLMYYLNEYMLPLMRDELDITNWSVNKFLDEILSGNHNIKISD